MTSEYFINSNRIPILNSETIEKSWIHSRFANQSTNQTPLKRFLVTDLK